MKKIIVVIFILMLAGFGLSFLSFKDDKALKQNAFTETVDSIRSLILVDNELNELILKARFGLDPDYEKITQVSQQLNAEFENLKSTESFQDLKQIKALDSAVLAFDKLSLERLKTINNFQTKNDRLRKFRKSFPVISSNFVKSLSEKEEDNSDDNDINESDDFSFSSNLKTIEMIGSTNNALFRYLLSDTKNDREIVINELSKIQSLKKQLKSKKNQQFHKVYIHSIKELLKTQQHTQRFLKSAINIPSHEKLNDIEIAFINHFDNAVNKSSKLRDALTVYGIIVLLFLIYLGFMLRKSFQGLEQKVAERTEEIGRAYSELQESQEQLIQSEKLASLGGMVAGVAHEMNTPLAYVSSNMTTIVSSMQTFGSSLENIEKLQQVLEKPGKGNQLLTNHLTHTVNNFVDSEAAEIFEECKELLEDGQYGLNEISNLVGSLKDFARLDRQTVDNVSIESCLDNTLTIATNHIRENKVSIECDYSQTPELECVPSKLNQLFLNIITNAAQAIGQEGGNLKISTKHTQDKIVIAFTDDGIGMDESTKKKMFDPFFTTKPIGQGTGLGMSIAYKIVQSHHGSIDVESEEGSGTTVTVKLPISQPEQAS